MPFHFVKKHKPGAYVFHLHFLCVYHFLNVTFFPSEPDFVMYVLVLGILFPVGLACFAGLLALVYLKRKDPGAVVAKPRMSPKVVACWVRCPVQVTLLH